jgi:uncharacterized protein (DUF1778 family)
MSGNPDGAAALAEASEILVSSTVKDPAAGSGLRFSDIVTKTLRGVPGTGMYSGSSKPGGQIDIRADPVFSSIDNVYTDAAYSKKSKPTDIFVSTHTGRIGMSPAAAKTRSAKATQTATRTTTINLRVSEVTRQLIDTAAAVVGKSRTEFMLESARQQAIDVLLDQRLFILNAEQHASFMNALDNPPPPNAELKKLLSSKSPWGK